MKRVPDKYLAPESRRIGELSDGERVWAFRDAMRVDKEGNVWPSRTWPVHKRRFPGMIELRRQGDQYHVRLPRRRYKREAAPPVGSDEWIPIASVQMFWSVFALLGW